MSPQQYDLVHHGHHTVAHMKRFIGAKLLTRATLIEARRSGHWVMISETDTHYYLKIVAVGRPLTSMSKTVKAFAPSR